ncbi:unnamed protein product [Malassezia sympodialis ATCC 42132]|uniref:Amino acid transporter transmembrane domain-containing protein n=1 Tax=Malassezia sympodialis (strain ATCC 42132) TaxID=1230383 RepID=M5EC41_MALS4|nr:uncharacterized protein MSY001_2680 [Malassezia sympodialis ATCC 42132]CCU99975.1 unnamed protein product [Malassezia sympodialis ATCC 42132]SHO76171.1 Uncharacterized protein MSYG_0506 [Malassezia sympodialis ATCC 42132]|eukprot:XP_018741194.1 uncharacterized protein MSY001_2680 [Malassezia sympodialis ATCC 42132]
METLGPSPAPGQKRTFVSRFFPNSDTNYIRRYKFLEEPEPSETAASGTPPPDAASDPAEKHVHKAQLEDGMVEQVNGPYRGEIAKPVQRSLGFFGAFFNMIAYSIALGILSIPMVVATIGMVPFVLLCCLFSFLTWYIGYNYWRIAMMYPGVQNLQQVGELIFGPIGGVIFATFQAIFSVFLQGNHVLLGGYAFYYLGWDACMIVMVLVFTIISFVFTLPRSYRLFSAFAAISFTSIFTVVIIAMIASGVSGPQNRDPSEPPKAVHAFGASRRIPHSFLDGVLGTTNVFVSFGAIPAYLPVVAEMKRPQDFHYSLIMLVAVSFVMYVIVGCIMNYNLGQFTTSPSLGSLTTVMIKVSYGLALPTILVAGCASGQVTGKMFMINVFSGARRRFLDNKVVTWTVWIVINIISWALAFVLAEVIPFFSTFLGLEASLFWSVFFFFAPMFYLWRHQFDYWNHWRNRLGTIVALVMIGMAGFFMIAGTWASAVSIRDLYKTGNVGSPFSCEMPSS